MGAAERLVIETLTSVAELGGVAECVLTQRILGHQCPVALPLVQRANYSLQITANAIPAG